MFRLFRWCLPVLLALPAIPAQARVLVGVVDDRFRLCSNRVHEQCVVDGDTFRLRGERIRIADIDAPEIRPARCEREADLGSRATTRMLALLNAGRFTLNPWPGRDRDRNGRLLRVVTRRGQSLGRILVDEGLARRWGGRRKPWC